MPTLLFVANITKRKRPILLIEALGLLRRQGIHCQLVLAGPVGRHNGYADMMRERARQCGIEEQVIWHGYTPDIAPLYRAADCFALPSEAEGMPNSLLEAMASGLPCVVTKASGVADLVTDHRDGLIVAPDAAAIAEAVSYFLEDESASEAYGAAAKQRMVQSFSADSVLRAHLKLFDAVLHGRDPADASLLPVE
jgi:glycosyltransferase involved in cell wall biosynthesis